MSSWLALGMATVKVQLLDMSGRQQYDDCYNVGLLFVKMLCCQHVCVHLIKLRQTNTTSSGIVLGASVPGKSSLTLHIKMQRPLHLPGMLSKRLPGTASKVCLYGNA